MMSGTDDNEIFNLYDVLIEPLLDDLRTDGTDNDPYITSGSNNFQYTTAQRFVPHYILNNENTRAMLVWHGMGTGKTCTGIQASHEFISKYPKTGYVHIICPRQAIIESWKNALNNTSVDIKKQCSSQYINAIEYDPKMKDDTNNHIRIYTVQSFLTMCSNLFITHDMFDTEYPIISSQRILQTHLSMYFKRSLIIIDEAHMNGIYPIDLMVKDNYNIDAHIPGYNNNKDIVTMKSNEYMDRLKSAPVWSWTTIKNIIMQKNKLKNNKSQKPSIPLSFIIGRIGATFRGCSALIMTATPAYDNHTRVYEIISMIRAFNGKKQLLQRSNINGKWIPGDMTLVAENMVTYVRGNDPYTFPIRLSYTDGDDEMIQSKMSKTQYMIWKNNTSNIRSDTTSIIRFFTAYTKSTSWMDNLNEYAPKLHKVLELISQPVSGKGKVDFTASSTGIVLITFAYKKSRDAFRECLKKFGYRSARNNEEVSDYKTFTTLESNNNNEYDHEILKRLIHPSNKDGCFIRIIIAMPKMLTGLSFKNIRQVHVIENWWNHDRIEQAIGRAFRRNSHIDLEYKHRNVIVFRHFLINDIIPLKERKQMDEDNIMYDDTHMINISNIKRKKSHRTLTQLKSIAIDCTLQKNITNSNYLNIIKKKYPSIEDTFGSIRSLSKFPFYLDTNIITCKSKQPVHMTTLKITDKSSINLRDYAIEYIIDIATALFRIYRIIPEAHVPSYIKLIASTSISSHHNSVKFYPLVMITEAINLMIQKRIVIIGPSGLRSRLFKKNNRIHVTPVNKTSVGYSNIKSNYFNKQVLYNNNNDNKCMERANNVGSDLLSTVFLKWQRSSRLYDILKIKHGEEQGFYIIITSIINSICDRKSSDWLRSIICWSQRSMNINTKSSDNHLGHVSLRNMVIMHFRNIISDDPNKIYIIFDSGSRNIIAYRTFMWNATYMQLYEIGVYRSKGDKIPIPSITGKEGVAYLKYYGWNSEPKLVINMPDGNKGATAYKHTTNKSFKSKLLINKLQQIGVLISNKTNKNNANNNVDKQADVVEIAIRSGIFENICTFHDRYDRLFGVDDK